MSSFDWFWHNVRDQRSDSDRRANSEDSRFRLRVNSQNADATSEVAKPSDDVLDLAIQREWEFIYALEMLEDLLVCDIDRNALTDAKMNDIVLDFEQWMARLAEQAIGSTHARAEILIELSDPKGGLCLIRSSDSDSLSWPKVAGGANRIEAYSQIEVRALSTGQTQIVPNVHLEPDYMPRIRLESVVAELVTPVLAGDTAVGVLRMGVNHVDWFTSEHVYCAEVLAGLIGLAELVKRFRGQDEATYLKTAIETTIIQRRFSLQEIELYYEDNLCATAIYPKVVPVDGWSSLLAYVHLEDATASVRMDALRFQNDVGPARKTAMRGPTSTLPLGTEILLMPAIGGVKFDPEVVSFQWAETWHRALFRFRHTQELAKCAANGEVRVLAKTESGIILIAVVKLAMMFEEEPSNTILGDSVRSYPSVRTTEYMYKRAFVSYSHHDGDAVHAYVRSLEALGITVLTDTEDLLSCQFFDQHIQWLIASSDVFELCWSQRAADSPTVTREWKLAVELDRGEGFIRPLYWDDPMPPPPPELAHIHFARLERGKADV